MLLILYSEISFSTILLSLATQTSAISNPLSTIDHAIHSGKIAQFNKSIMYVSC